MKLKLPLRRARNQGDAPALTDGAPPKRRRRRRWVKRVIALAVVAGVAFGGYWYFLGSGRNSAAAADTTYTTAQVERRDITATITGSGTLEAADSYSVTTLLEGTILTAGFEEGDQVEEGTVLYTIDSSDAASSLEQSQISVNQAQRNYNNAVDSLADLTVTATGRLSSTEPNLQNIPTRTDLGSEIRKMFIPADGCVLVDADYSQIELRLLAHISGDEGMREAFLSGGDFHAETAAKVFHVAPQDVTHEMRRRAKAVNFGIVYGISAFSLSQDIGSTVAEAKAYMEAYFATFPGVRKYMDTVVEKARETGFVETLFHRRRDLPELTSSNRNLRAFGERVALNMPIQGTAADIMKLAMIAVWRRLKDDLPQARLVLQVHDELIVECPEADAPEVARILAEEMERVATLSVPLTAEAHWGKNWLEAKD